MLNAVKKILITGATGFTGRNLKEALDGKYHIYAPSHSELELLDKDAVSSFMADNNIEVVIHAACKPAHRNARDFTNLVEDNTSMFLNLLSSNDRLSKMIYLSSGAVYDMRHYQPKMKEEYFGKHIPGDDTGLYKYTAARSIEEVEGVVELRLFGLFGKYEDYAIRFISNMICKAIFDLPLTMCQNRKFDYLYVDDLPQVVEYFIENESRYKAYNVTPDDSIALYDLAQVVLRICGKDLPIEVDNQSMGLEYSGDNSRLRSEMPQLKFTPIEVAVKELYEWYLKNKAMIDREQLLVDK